MWRGRLRRYVEYVAKVYLVVIEGGRLQVVGHVPLADVVGGETHAQRVEASAAVWGTERATHTATRHATRAEERMEGHGSSTAGLIWWRGSDQRHAVVYGRYGS